jgi:hypothetical protein
MLTGPEQHLCVCRQTCGYLTCRQRQQGADVMVYLCGRAAHSAGLHLSDSVNTTVRAWNFAEPSMPDVRLVRVLMPIRREHALDIIRRLAPWYDW